MTSLLPQRLWAPIDIAAGITLLAVSKHLAERHMDSVTGKHNGQEAGK